MGYVASHYLRNSLKLEGKVYLVGMAGFGRELELQGISYTGPGVRIYHPPRSHWLIVSCRRIQCL